MAARQTLMIATESAFGTTTTSPVLGTDKFYMRLDKDNSFTGDMVPQHQPIMYGGGVVIEADTVATPKVTRGTFDFILYPGVFSSILLKWAITPTNSGGTVPWTTTPAAIQPVGDLASLSIYRMYLREDGTTLRRHKFTGCKCETWRISASQDGANRIWRLSGTWVGKLREGNAFDGSSDPTSTPFPVPADTDYPTSPYTFAHLATGSGVVTIGTSGGSNRAATCASVTIEGRNSLETNFYTSEFPACINYFGRDVTAQVVLRDTASPDDMTTWLALSPITTTIKIDNSTNSLNFAFNANNVFRPWAIELPNAGRYRQGMTIKNRYSTSAGGDIALTAA